MEIEIKKAKLTKSLFEQLPLSSIAKLSNVAEVYGFVRHKGAVYALAKADVYFKTILYSKLDYSGGRSVCTGNGASIMFRNEEDAANWINLYTALKAKAEAAGQVFL